MPKAKNPFTPAFGSEPYILAGRDHITDGILGGLSSGLGDPNRASILIGPSGSGKTVLLTKIAFEASQAGWIPASVTAAPGMLLKTLEQIEHTWARQGSVYLAAAERLFVKEL